MKNLNGRCVLLGISKCMVDTFDRDFQFDVRHISVAKEADVILVAPATADIIAKMAHGIADDMLTTVVLAARCPKYVSPSMNTAMLENPITQDNIALLRKYGFSIIDSASGYLACGAEIASHSSDNLQIQVVGGKHSE